MKSRKLSIELPESILTKLQREKETFDYKNVQEIIVDILRDKYLRGKGTGKRKGRPKKIDESRVLSRKKVFHKKGVPIDV
jgi:hypothetical protein